MSCGSGRRFSGGISLAAFPPINRRYRQSEPRAFAHSSSASARSCGGDGGKLKFTFSPRMAPSALIQRRAAALTVQAGNILKGDFVCL